MTDLDSLKRARRLEEMGIHVRSAELTEQAKSLREFNARGGNRRMRRAAARRKRRR